MLLEYAAEFLTLETFSKRIECIQINLHIVARQEESPCDLAYLGGAATDAE